MTGKVYFGLTNSDKLRFHNKAYLPYTDLSPNLVKLNADEEHAIYVFLPNFT